MIRNIEQTVVTVPPSYVSDVSTLLAGKGIKYTLFQSEYTVRKADVTAMNEILDSVILPNLLPSQFYWMLTTAKLDEPIKTLLVALEQNDPEKHAIYKAFLKGARFYEFDRVVAMLKQASPVLKGAYPDLDLSVPTLKTLWRQAQLV